MDSVHSMVISVMDRDRPGIVAEVTEGISALGGNLADLSQTVLCGYFTMILIARFPSGISARQVEQTLSEGISSRVIVEPVKGKLSGKEVSEHVYVLSAIGRNRVGFVAQVSRFCSDRDANILDLASHAEGDLYTMMLQLDMSNVKSMDDFEAELRRFGNAADFNLVLQHNDIFRATNEI